MQVINKTVQLISRKYNPLYKQLFLMRRYSNRALQPNVSNFSSFSLCEKDPTEQTIDDYLKMYSIPDRDINGVLFHAVPRKFMDLCKTLNTKTLLIRKQALSIINALEESQSKTPLKFLLHGPDGGGKSLSLLHILHYCFLKNWVILYVPNGYRFVDSQRQTQVQQSLWNTSRMDQPEESISWLNIFRSMNSKFLAEVKTTQEYKWGKRESTAKDKPLMEVLEQGVGRNLYANDAVGVILKEIQQNTEIDVLYAVDGFNGFFGNTSHTVDRKPVKIHSLSLVHHFTKLLKPDHSFTKGAFVTATSRSVQFLGAAKFDENPQTLNNLFNRSALSHLHDFMDVEVPQYDEEEFITMMNYYSEKGWLAREMTDMLLNEIRFITNRNPNLMHKMLASL